MNNRIAIVKQCYGIIRKLSTSVKNGEYAIQDLVPEYGGKQLITMVPGVGYGPQLMKYVKDVFETAHVPIHFEVIEVDPKNHEQQSHEIVSSFLRNRVGIKGHISPSPYTSTNVMLRNELDLFVDLVHCKSYANVKCKHPNLDILLFRQNTEGEYAMLEHQLKTGIVESLKIITRKNTKRFARWAFEFMRKNGRERLVVVHKANIMKFSDGLFVKTVMDTSKEYPDIKVSDLIIDNCCMQLVARPKIFDVLIMPNLYGNIITNILCGLTGGPGLISGQNYGESAALFEVASRLTLLEDKVSLNPCGMLNAAVNMLRYLRKFDHAKLIDNAIKKTVTEDRIHSSDIGGTFSHDDVVENIKKHIQQDFKETGLPLF